MFQVDAALGAEEMVENLTTKCLDLEDQVKTILTRLKTTVLTRFFGYC